MNISQDHQLPYLLRSWDSPCATAVHTLFKNYGLLEKISAELEIPDGPMSIQEISAFINPTPTCRGHHREVYKLTIEASANDDTYKGDFALKLTTSHGNYRMNYEDCSKEVRICTSLGDNPRFREFFSRSLGAVELENSHQDRPTRNDTAINICGQIDTWVQGRTMSHILMCSSDDTIEQTKSILAECLRTVTLIWRDFSHEGNQIIPDTGLDDMIIVNRAPTFVDLDGGRRCGGGYELIVALAQFSKEARKRCPESLYNRIVPLLNPHALATCLLQELGRDLAKQVIADANKNMYNFPADFRTMFLPEITKIIE
jgi:hypothetical protein